MKQLEKTLIIQHSIATPPGSTLQFLNDRALPYQVMMASELANEIVRDGTGSATNWGNLLGFENLILCGGGMNVDQEDQYPWLKQEKLLIAQFVKTNKRILGLCLGGQLIAEVLGAKVQKHDAWEAGWKLVAIDSTASPLLQFSPSQLEVFQFHAYRFFLPEGARRFAENSICQDQGFVFGNRTVAFQFHPESTQQWIYECTLDDPQEGPYPVGEFVQPASLVLEQLGKQPALQDWYFNFLQSWIQS